MLRLGAGSEPLHDIIGTLSQWSNAELVLRRFQVVSLTGLLGQSELRV